MMEPEKHSNNSDTSTAGTDLKPTEDSAAATSGGGAVVGRSYDCAFCRRGFTNAQALGGHMNIHRKDKAKAKAKLHKNQNSKSKEKFKNLSYFSPISSSGGYLDYEICFPSSNHAIQTGDCFPVWRGDKMDGLFARVEDEGEVDLELRLGQYP